VYGRARNVTFTRGGSAAAGWTWTLRMQPVPAAWNLDTTCEPGSCGDDSTVASTVYSGFLTGYVTDLETYTEVYPGEREQRTGFVHAYNAQYANQPYYDFDTRSLVIQLANPHLRAPGMVATGSYEAFIPNAMLVGAMAIPDPSTLAGGSFTVFRSTAAATTTVPFTLTHETGGIQIRIADITYSSPTYRIRPRYMKPGAPRLRSAVRSSPTSTTMRFRAPIANGGRPVLRYVARCTAPRRLARTASSRTSPIVVGMLAAGATWRCSVRAVNAVGIGSASVVRTLAPLA
jgi:hypothetical protein